jgi:hypothetical protein
MTKHLGIVAVCLTALLLAAAVQAEDLKSGPQAGKPVPGPFHPLNCTGESAGKKACLFCKNGENPVAMIFARQPSPALTKLIKKIDEATIKNKGQHMGSFVVFLSDSEQLEGELKDLAKKENLQECVLSIDNPAGPKAYNVAKDADVTVVLYTERTVKANHAFRKGELKDKDIDQIVADVSKILPPK